TIAVRPATARAPATVEQIVQLISQITIAVRPATARAPATVEQIVQLIAQITIAVPVRTTTTVRTTLEQLLQLVVEIAVALAVAEEAAEVDLGLAAAPVTEQVLEDVVDIGVAAAVPAAEAATATAALQRLRVVERRQIRLRAEVGVLEVAHRLACRLVQQVHDFLDVIVDVTIGLL